MIVGVPQEIYPGERRVALVPVVVPMLAKVGPGSGRLRPARASSAGYPDAEYQDKGAKIAGGSRGGVSQSDIIAQVLGYGANDKNGGSDLALMRREQVVDRDSCGRCASAE